MKRYAPIFLLASLLLGSCSHRVQKGIHVKENKRIATNKTEMKPAYWMAITFPALVFVHVMTQP